MPDIKKLLAELFGSYILLTIGGFAIHRSPSAPARANNTKVAAAALERGSFTQTPR